MQNIKTNTFVKASTRKLDTNTDKGGETKYSTHSPTCTKQNTRKACALNICNDDVMRSKAGSYLMAARGLLKKVSRIDCSLSLVNLK